MTIQQLRADMVSAMKAHDKEKKEAISSLVGAVMKAAIDSGNREDIPESLVDQVILKELKTVQEQLETCPENREDLKAEYRFRFDTIKVYAPVQMGEEDVRAYLMEHFPEQIAAKNKGALMKAAMGDLKGKADGKMINRIAAELVG